MIGNRLATAYLVKNVLDLLLVVGLIVSALLAIYVLLSPFVIAGPDSRADVSVIVTIGDRTFLPIVRFDSSSPVAATRPALVNGTAELRFETTSWPLQFISNASTLVGLGVLTYIVWVLRKVLVAVLDARPFDPANARALHLLAMILIVAGFLFPLCEHLVARWVLAAVAVEGIALSPPFRMNLTPILVGLMLEVLAAIFMHGADLERDRSLTI